MDRPQGTVTFLFTDIEGSTGLWEQYPEAMRSVLARHDVLLRQAIEQAHGYVFKTIGDAFCAAFSKVSDALSAALAAQRDLPSLNGLLAPNVGIRVRMALHTGVPEFRDDDYFGPPLNRVARLLAVGHGGQILLSSAAKELLSGSLPADVQFQDMGLHRLRDLQRPEQVFLALHPELGSEFPPLKSLDYVPTNLPKPMTSFIGRAAEIAEVRQILAGARLLTLTGPGGSGKTRLALQIGADSIDDYKDGVWQVEMASLSDTELVPQAVATTLGVREQAGRPILEALTDHLADRQLLLILDNCEHLLTSCRTLSDSLLRRCTGLTILATSTENLHIQGERIYVVPTLSLPALPSGRASHSSRASPTLPDLAALHDSEAVRLFVERASFALSTFALTAQNGLAVAQVCHRLDGIPLAIELAAARVKVLSVEQIAQRLDDRFRLLVGGNRTAMPRQQTLRALVDWSYELLTPQERTLLCRLAVFSGGWTLEATEQVCSDSGSSVSDSRQRPASAQDLQLQIESDEALDLLTSLVEKSLVLYEEGQHASRYRLLETIRQYGLERLNRDEPASPVWRTHLDYFAAVTGEAMTHMADAEQIVWLRRLDSEHDNLRSALGWALRAEENETTPDAQDKASYTPQRLGLRMAGELAQFWLIRGYWTEGRQQLAAFLSYFQDRTEIHETTDWANALNGAGALAWAQGDLQIAQTHFEVCLAVWRQCGNVRGEAKAMGNLGVIALYQKDYATAQQLQVQGLEILTSLQDRGGMAATLMNLGMGAYEQHEYEASQAYYREAIDLYRALGNRGSMAECLNTLGLIDGKSGNYSAARQTLAVAEATFRELGSRGRLAEVLHSQAEVAYLHGEDATALSALAESLDLSRELGEGRSLVASLTLQAKVALRLGDYSLAAQSYRECMAFCLEKNLPRDMAEQTEELADVAFALEQKETFLYLYTIATRLRERYQIPRDPGEEEVMEQRRRDALGRVSEATAAAILQTGSALSPEQLPTALLEPARIDDP